MYLFKQPTTNNFHQDSISCTMYKKKHVTYFICFTIVLLPDSPAPNYRKIVQLLAIEIEFFLSGTYYKISFAKLNM